MTRVNTSRPYECKHVLRRGILDSIPCGRMIDPGRECARISWGLNGTTMDAQHPQEGVGPQTDAMSFPGLQFDSA